VLQTISTAYAEGGLRVISVPPSIPTEAAAAADRPAPARQAASRFRVIDDRDRRIARHTWARPLRLPLAVQSWTGREGADGRRRATTDDPATFLPRKVSRRAALAPTTSCWSRRSRWVSTFITAHGDLRALGRECRGRSSRPIV